MQHLQFRTFGMRLFKYSEGLVNYKVDISIHPHDGFIGKEKSVQKAPSWTYSLDKGSFAIDRLDRIVLGG